MAKIPIPTHVKLVNGLGNDQRKELIKDATDAFIIKKEVPDSYKRFAKAEAEAARKEKILNANPGLREKLEKRKALKSDNTSTTELQSGPLTAEEYSKLSGNNFFTKSSDLMGKRLANKYNEIKAKRDDFEKQLNNNKITRNDYNSKIQELFNSVGNNVKSMNDVSRILQQEAQNGPGIRDYVHAYSGHVVGAGMVLGMGNAVLDAADTKGQKTNAQLYSNPF